MATNIALWAPRMLSVLRIITGLLFLDTVRRNSWAFHRPSKRLRPCSRLSVFKGYWNSLVAFSSS
jgi:hypothetical protein